jgi:tetratricopeptide (TPR) repeat protein
MKTRIFVLVAVLFCCAVLNAQVTRISLPAGTPEDKALQAITAEPDAQKRITLIDQFLKDFVSNKDAVAFGNWQMAQAYQATGDNERALAFGEKALANAPNNIEIMVSLAGIADSIKDYDKVVEFAAAGGTVFNLIAAQTKPAEVAAEDWAQRINGEQAAAKSSYDYLEVAGYNAISAEPNAKKRMELIERYTPAFPRSRFEEPLSQLALASLQELKDTPRAIAFGEKSLKQNPESVPTLLLLANTYIEDPKTLDKAVTYAGKAVKLTDGGSNKLASRMARSTYGYALLRQEKALASVPELKQAVELLADNDPVRAEALYRLGFAYAKLGKRPEAKAAVEKCMSIEGPYQPFAKELLEKLNAPARAKSK